MERKQWKMKRKNTEKTRSALGFNLWRALRQTIKLLWPKYQLNVMILIPDQITCFAHLKKTPNKTFTWQENWREKTPLIIAEISDTIFTIITIILWITLIVYLMWIYCQNIDTMIYFTHWTKHTLKSMYTIPPQTWRLQGIFCFPCGRRVQLTGQNVKK